MSTPWEPSGHVRIDAPWYDRGVFDHVHDIMHDRIRKLQSKWIAYLERNVLIALERGCDLAAWRTEFPDDLTYMFRCALIPLDIAYEMEANIDPCRAWPEYANAEIIHLHDLRALAVLSGDQVPTLTDVWIKDVLC